MAPPFRLGPGGPEGGEGVEGRACSSGGERPLGVREVAGSIPARSTMHHSLARAHGGATGVLDRVVRALNPSAARGSGWRYQPGWYHGDRFRPQRTEAAVFY